METCKRTSAATCPAERGSWEVETRRAEYECSQCRKTAANFHSYTCIKYFFRIIRIHARAARVIITVLENDTEQHCNPD